jgi:hypothetical protein
LLEILILASADEASKINFRSDDTPFVVGKCYALQVLSFEKGAETFYWEKGNFKSVPTGD